MKVGEFENRDTGKTIEGHFYLEFESKEEAEKIKAFLERGIKEESDDAN